MSRDIFCACRSMTATPSRYSSSVPAYFLIQLHWARMTAVGVLSSWDASEANCFSVSKECSRRSNIWSKLPARRRASSEPRESPIRRVRSRPSVILPAVFAICSMGSRALLTIRYPPREAERMIKGSMRKNINSMLPASWLLLWRWMAPRIQTPSSHPQGTHRSDT